MLLMICPGGRMTENEEIPWSEDHDEHWAALNEALTEASRSFDRTVLTLAGGALVLSIGFLRDVAPKPEAIEIVITAWAFLTASLISTMVSYFTAERGLEYSLRKLQKGEFDKSRGGTWGNVTDILNRIAGASFLVGAILLVVFAVINVPEGR